MLLSLSNWNLKGKWFQAYIGQIQVRYREKVFYTEVVVTLEQVAQRCGGRPVPGDFEGES